MALTKYAAYFTWFSKHLETLHHDRRVSTKIYVTRASAADAVPQRQPSSSRSTSSSTSVEPDLEKDIFPDLDTARLPLDTEKRGIPRPITSAEGFLPGGTNIYLRRPDVGFLVKELMESTPSNKRVLVMGCGPKTLMSTVQNATSDCIMDNGAGVELHLEQFGW
jgi:hypothetical protein